MLEGNKKQTKAEGRRTKEAVYTMFEMAQKCVAALLQVSKDAVLPSLAQMNLVTKEQGGGIAQYVYKDSLVDTVDENLIGSEGAFLRRLNYLYKADF